MAMVSINPFTEEVNERFEIFDAEKCHAAIQQSRQAYPPWRGQKVAGRIEYLPGIAQKLRDNKQDYAEIITKEMGKPIREAISEIEKCAWLCDYYFDSAERFLADEAIATESAKSYVTFQPLGVILGIMPWNFPFWQVFRYAIPALSAGNVCLLKHASNVPMTALAIERLFREAGLPPAVFQTLLTDSATTMQLIDQDQVDGVSLTGSLGAGSAVGALAGKRIRKLVLELGGSDPFVVLADADLDRAAETGVRARTINTGQSCIAAKRFIVMKSVAEDFQRRFVDHLRALKMGDPMLQETDLGPLAKEEIAETLREQVRDAEARGARLEYGPEPPSGKGFFFRPVVVTGVTPEMKIVTEEVFGPIAPIIVVESEEQALRVANATEFGLGASVWSRDRQRAERLAAHIDSGFVAINDMVKSDPRLPFGGVKKSGVGRELDAYGLKEFVNIKTVVVQ